MIYDDISESRMRDIIATHPQSTPAMIGDDALNFLRHVIFGEGLKPCKYIDSYDERDIVAAHIEMPDNWPYV